jgi:hypothetical protein
MVLYVNSSNVTLVVDVAYAGDRKGGAVPGKRKSLLGKQVKD